MQAVFALLALVAAANAGLIGAPATYISRAPAFDSAVIKSDRLGGNFAYSVAENHAYAAHTPIVQQVVSPVGVSYSAPAYAAASPLAYSGVYNGAYNGVYNGAYNGLYNGLGGYYGGAYGLGGAVVRVA